MGPDETVISKKVATSERHNESVLGQMACLALCCLQRPFTPQEMEGHWLYVMGVSILMFFPPLMAAAVHLPARCGGVEKRVNYKVANNSITHAHSQAAHTNIQKTPRAVCVCVCVCVQSRCALHVTLIPMSEAFGLKLLWQELASLSWDLNSLICFQLLLVSTVTPSLWSQTASSTVEVDCIACRGTHTHTHTAADRAGLQGSALCLW